MTQHTVLVESSGNQAYIFATNRLRENVGASSSVRKVGEIARTAAEENSKIKVVLATSGKAIVIADDEEAAKGFVQRVSKQALIDLPGLDISGASVEYNRGDATEAQEAIAAVHRRILKVRSTLPGPHVRFPMGPFLRLCDTSGYPAEELRKVEDRTEAQSAVTQAKWKAAKEWGRFLGGLLPKGDRFARNIGELEENLADDRRWMAVVHADGDRIGRTFLNFTRFRDEIGQPVQTADEYLDAYTRFSEGLEKVSVAAFKTALAAVAAGTKTTLNIIPLILGGDDLTFLCDATVAIPLVAAYLDWFGKLTEANLGKKFTASAGIAFTKTHFPFHTGYGLAEELIRSAKKMEGASSLDFHVVYDSTLASVESARAILRFDGVRLYGGPYILDDFAEGGRLASQVAHLSRTDDAALPRNQVHFLREGLFAGKEEADRRVAYLRPRHTQAAGPLLEDGSLFASDGSTVLLDALALSEFWNGTLAEPAPSGAQT